MTALRAAQELGSRSAIVTASSDRIMASGRRPEAGMGRAVRGELPGETAPRRNSRVHHAHSVVTPLRRSLASLAFLNNEHGPHELLPFRSLPGSCPENGTR